MTDGVIGPDGAMYFMTGGRRLDSDLYRVHYTGNEAVTAANKAPELTDGNKIRRQLEAYHAGPKSGAIDFAWPYLKSEDR